MASSSFSGVEVSAVVMPQYAGRGNGKEVRRKIR